MTESGKSHTYSKDRVRKVLSEILPKECLLEMEPLKKHTTFRIGGPADFFVRPNQMQQLAKIVAFCREHSVPYFLLGNGSNLCVSDEGYRGVMIQIFQNMSKLTIQGNRLIADAGVLLSKAANQAAEEGLTGMEFASGIPGTLGGAIVMNAGAYGGEMKDIVENVTVLTPEGELRRLSLQELGFSYRTSCIEKEGMIVLSVELLLSQGEKEEIHKTMEELRRRRIEKQPLEYPSAGSTFKRPEGYFAGKLIMDSGLRGYRCGDAMVSEKHCGFIVNAKDATAAEVRQLIEEVQEKVFESFGVHLETEIKML